MTPAPGSKNTPAPGSNPGSNPRAIDATSYPPEEKRGNPGMLADILDQPVAHLTVVLADIKDELLHDDDLGLFVGAATEPPSQLIADKHHSTHTTQANSPDRPCCAGEFASDPRPATCNL